MMTLTEFLGFIILVLMVALAAILVDNHFLHATITTQDIKIKTMGLEITDQNNAVDMLVKAQQAKDEQLLYAQTYAKKLEEDSLKEASQILKQVVPADCKSAVKWGAKQGSSLYECFKVECPIKH